jgi:hypothetical protein
MNALLKVVLCLAAFAGAFAFHQWWQSQPDLGGGTLDNVLASPEDLLQDMQENVTKLANVVQPDGDRTEAATSVHELITATDATLLAIQEKGEAVGKDLLSEASVVQLNAYFIAQVLQPQSYREPLIKLCNQLELDVPNSPFAFQASALRFAGQHDLTQPLDEQGFEALASQADGYTQPGYGAALYSFVSKQLNVNGHASSAKKVLAAGLERYRGQAGWHDLFQQQFAQGHLKAPEPKVPGGAFEPTFHSGPSNQSDTESDPLYAQGREIMEYEAKLNKELIERNHDFIRRARQDMVKRGVTHFEQSVNGGKTVVHVRGGQAVPVP